MSMQFGFATKRLNIQHRNSLFQEVNLFMHIESHREKQQLFVQFSICFVHLLKTGSVCTFFVADRCYLFAFLQSIDVILFSSGGKCMHKADLDAKKKTVKGKLCLLFTHKKQTQLSQTDPCNVLKIFGKMESGMRVNNMIRIRCATKLFSHIREVVKKLLEFGHNSTKWTFNNVVCMRNNVNRESKQLNKKGHWKF